MTKLLLVESPTKAKRIASFLVAPAWKVIATRGHLRDLPPDSLGIDIDHGFAMSYVTLPAQKALIGKLRTAVSAAESIYLATDPDREGEAIAWHVADLLKTEIGSKPVHRVVCTAITPVAVQAALAASRPIDLALVEAQQARRTVDRLVGYLTSPFACKLLDTRVSAGRVQSVCLRLLVEREKAREDFEAQHYWTLGAMFSVNDITVDAQLARVQGKSPALTRRDIVDRLMAGLQSAVFWVEAVSQVERKRSPLPPFTTATMQQAASNALGYSADRTMKIAQTLYENGLITYIRTASTLVPPDAITNVHDVIRQEYGANYVAKSNVTVAKPIHVSSEAHEAIRPTDVTVRPSEIRSAEGAKLYDLIWRRFVAAHMADATYNVSGAKIYAGKAPAQPYPLEFHAKGRTLRFDGFLKVYEEALDEGETHILEVELPLLEARQILTLKQWQAQEHVTSAPDRYTEASLIRALEQHGIGRPSTYAVMLTTLRERQYFNVAKKRLVPTALGIQLSLLLSKHFPRCFENGYTASLEAALDQIAHGKLSRLQLLQLFWKRDFAPPLKLLAAQVRPPLADGTPMSSPLGNCPRCGAPLIERRGRHGTFAGCSQYPRCQGTGLSRPPHITTATSALQGVSPS
ncbi:MAG: type I DNA topoisomerase [Anaerolineae bacterium]|nr:type I DNA topoisomerase [Anaerolineae bacterium]